MCGVRSSSGISDVADDRGAVRRSKRGEFVSSRKAGSAAPGCSQLEQLSALDRDLGEVQQTLSRIGAGDASVAAAAVVEVVSAGLALVGRVTDLAGDAEPLERVEYALRVAQRKAAAIDDWTSAAVGELLDDVVEAQRTVVAFVRELHEDAQRPRGDVPAERSEWPPLLDPEVHDELTLFMRFGDEPVPAARYFGPVPLERESLTCTHISEYRADVDRDALRPALKELKKLGLTLPAAAADQRFGPHVLRCSCGGWFSRTNMPWSEWAIERQSEAYFISNHAACGKPKRPSRRRAAPSALAVE
jgi:hypothetical protein